MAGILLPNVVLPFPTKAGDHTKIQVILHENRPTKSYRNLCSRCETHWCIWFGLAGHYHSLPWAILACILPQGTFTKHHRLVIATGIIDCYNELDVLLMVGYELVPIYFALGIGRVVTGLCE